MNRVMSKQITILSCRQRLLNVPDRATRYSLCSLLPAPCRRGLTLIELLVVIIILVTLVGGVLPLLSPNNDAKKIQAASRSLQTYLQKAQTKALRTGRPVGVMFRETQVGSGFALEAYQVEEPPAFTGFSSSSTARFTPMDPTGSSSQGGLLTGNYFIEFGEGFGNSFVSGFDSDSDFYHIPPAMVKVGDLIEVGNSVFRLIVFSDREIDPDLGKETGERFFRPSNRLSATLVAGPSPPVAPIAFKDVSFPSSYSIQRQPVVNSETPLTLPKGVALDMSASGIERGIDPMLFGGLADGNQRKNGAVDGDNLKQIGLMFSPAGGVEYVHYNGTQLMAMNDDLVPMDASTEPIKNIGQVVFLLAMVEKSGLPVDARNDFNDPWVMKRTTSDEDLQEARDKVSWLNPDSRWISVNGRSGLIRVAGISFSDPRLADFESQSNAVFKYEAYMQIVAARGEFSVSSNAFLPVVAGN